MSSIIKTGDIVEVIDTRGASDTYVGQRCVVLSQQPDTLTRVEDVVTFRCFSMYAKRFRKVEQTTAPKKAIKIKSVKVSEADVHAALTRFVKDELGIDATVTKIVAGFKQSVELVLGSEAA